MRLPDTVKLSQSPSWIWPGAVSGCHGPGGTQGPIPAPMPWTAMRRVPGCPTSCRVPWRGPGSRAMQAGCRDPALAPSGPDVGPGRRAALRGGWRCAIRICLAAPPARRVNRVKILYWERNGFCLWLKRLDSERFKTSPDPTDEAIILTVQELNWLLDGFDLWRNRPHQVLTPRYVA